MSNYRSAFMPQQAAHIPAAPIGVSLNGPRSQPSVIPALNGVGVTPQHRMGLIPFSNGSIRSVQHSRKGFVSGQDGQPRATAALLVYHNTGKMGRTRRTSNRHDIVCLPATFREHANALTFVRNAAKDSKLDSDIADTTSLSALNYYLKSAAGRQQYPSDDPTSAFRLLQDYKFMGIQVNQAVPARDSGCVTTMSYTIVGNTKAIPNIWLGGADEYIAREKYREYGDRYALHSFLFLYVAKKEFIARDVYMNPGSEDNNRMAFASVNDDVDMKHSDDDSETDDDDMDVNANQVLQILPYCSKSRSLPDHVKNAIYIGRALSGMGDGNLQKYHGNLAQSTAVGQIYNAISPNDQSDYHKGILNNLPSVEVMLRSSLYDD